MKALRLSILGLVIAAFVFTDFAPSFAVAEDTIVVAQQQQPRKKRRTLMDLLFGEPEPPRRIIEVPAQPPVQKKRRTQQPAAAAQKPAAPPPPPKPTIEKADDAMRVAVYGDSLAVDLGKAMERFYAEDANLIVIPRGVGSSGFVREDFFDWDKQISEDIAADNFDLAVVMIGINDRQQLTADGKTYKPLTEAWNEEYKQRISAVIKKLRSAGKPTVWVGLPPMSKTDYSTAMSQISAIQRLASFSGGAEFLDIYERFVDEEGKYTSFGPDLNGQNVRVRREDGIHMTAAGADKLAFFVSQSVKEFYNGGGPIIEVADPLLGSDAQMMMRPPYQGLGQIRQLEVAGAVVPLSQTPERAGELLTAQTIPAAPQQTFDLEQLMQAPIGRVDAFGVGIDPEAEDEQQTEASPAPQ